MASPSGWQKQIEDSDIIAWEMRETISAHKLKEFDFLHFDNSRIREDAEYELVMSAKRYQNWDGSPN